MTGKNSKKAFSLFEMTVVVGILALLAYASVPIAELSFNGLKEAELEESLYRMREAIGLWRRDCRNAVVAQYGYENLNKVPYSELCPPSLEALLGCNKSSDGKYYDISDNCVSVITNNSGTQIATFTPKKYLDSIPIDPFVGRACWLLHIASGTADFAVYGLRKNETEAVSKVQLGAGTSYLAEPIGFDGIFDLSCVASNTVDADDYYTRRGYNISVDGTLFEDW